MAGREHIPTIIPPSYRRPSQDPLSYLQSQTPSQYSGRSKHIPTSTPYENREFYHPRSNLRPQAPTEFTRRDLEPFVPSHNTRSYKPSHDSRQPVSSYRKYVMEERTSAAAGYASEYEDESDLLVGGHSSSPQHYRDEEPSPSKRPRLSDNQSCRIRPENNRDGEPGLLRRPGLSHEDHSRARDCQSPYPVTEPASAPDREDYPFNNIGRNLSYSRYSGVTNPWGLNKNPPMVPQAEVSDAALKKRGLKRGRGDKVCKRGYGANDPENIRIVNLKERDGLSFEQIKEILNAERIKTGRDPSFSVCGVTGRYNRTAPLLFAAEGHEFVPLSQRGRRGKSNTGLSTGQPAWDDQLDLILVECVKEYESQKWIEVSAMFRAKTGVDMNEKAVAKRYTLM